MKERIKDFEFDADKQDCSYCCGAYGNSRFSEEWIQYSGFGKWANEESTNFGEKNVIFFCKRCD